MKNFFLLLVLSQLVFCSCGRLSPDMIEVPHYPAIEAVYAKQVEQLANRKLIKTVTLGTQTETDTLTLDSARWIAELSFMKELFPNTPEYVGVFDVSEMDNQVTLRLKPTESGILKKLLVMNPKEYVAISATVHDFNYFYVDHREVNIKLEDGLIASFEILGYQKMLLKDTIKFSISGTILE